MWPGERALASQANSPGKAAFFGPWALRGPYNMGHHRQVLAPYCYQVKAKQDASLSITVFYCTIGP